MTSRTPRCAIAIPCVVLALCAGTASRAADVFVPPGAKATLSVDYLYESAGKKRMLTVRWRFAVQ